MKRREFLNLSLTAGAGLLASQFLARHARADGTPASADFLLVITMDYGWDTSMSLDPWIGTRLPEKDVYLDYADSEIITKGNLSIGPAMTSMSKWMDRFSVVRGILCSKIEVGHDAPRNFMVSGDSTGVNANLALEYEDSKAETILGAIVNNTYHGQSKAKNLDLNSLKDIKPSEVDPAMQNDGFSVLEGILNSKIKNSTQFASYSNQIDVLTKAQVTLNEGHYIGAAMAVGLTRSASLSLSTISLGLDSHSSHPTNHKTAQTKCWDTISNILQALQNTELAAGVSVLDRTTVYVVSDFDRTPSLDSSQGTDHNPRNNAALVMGPRIKPNMSVGNSLIIPSAQLGGQRSMRIAGFLDKNSFSRIQNADEGAKSGIILSPANVIATLIEALGIPRASSPIIPLDINSISVLLKS